MANELLTLVEVSERSKLSTKAVRGAIVRGELVARKLCGRWRIRERDFDAWVERGKFLPPVAASLPEPAIPAQGSLAALRRIEAEAA
jgi:Helix-turn-helix domain